MATTTTVEQPVIKKTDIQERLHQILTGKNGLLARDKIDEIDDHAWIKESSTSYINIGGNTMASKMIRFHSSADVKGHSTGIGNTIVLNPLPQFTRYADTRSIGIGGTPVNITGKNNNIGMGLYYSEAIDDTQQKIYMQMGVPEFNSLVSFFVSFYDNDMARMARTGSIMGSIGNAIGTVLTAVIKVFAAPLYIGAWVLDAINLISNTPSNRYYYHRETMHTYWMSVNYMLNEIANYARITPWRTPDDATGDGGEKINNDTGLDKEIIGGDDPSTNVKDYFNTMIPGLIDSKGFIDVIKIVSLGLHKQILTKEAITNANISINRTASYNSSYTTELFNLEGFYGALDGAMAGKATGIGLQKLLSEFFNSKTPFIQDGGGGFTDEQIGWTAGGITSEGGGQFDGMKESAANIARSFDVISERSFLNAKGEHVSHEQVGKFKGLIQSIVNVTKVGGMWLPLRVDSTESVSESFSNQTTESDISQKFNSMSGQARNASFDLAGGNVDGGVISGVINGIKGLLQGTLSNIGFSGLISLAGAAFVDIPKHWDNSSGNLPEMRYSMTLVSPYGNALSHLLYVDLPICCLLAAALPISTGPQSYTSPFLVKLFDRGKAQTRLGMISDLSITRGITNLGFDKDKRFLGAEVSFTVQDLSTVVHMPMLGGTANPLGILTNFLGLKNYSERLKMEDSNFFDYLQVLAACDPSDSMYGYKRFHRVMRMANLRNASATNPEHMLFAMSNMVSSLAPVDMLVHLISGSRIYEENSNNRNTGGSIGDVVGRTISEWKDDFRNMIGL